MIDRDEFERRVNFWFALIMSALNENVHRLLSEGKAFTPADLDNPAFATAMRKAAAYQAQYLSDDVLECFLDPAFLQGMSHLEFLIRQALIQKTAQLQAEQCIERARRHG